VLLFCFSILVIQSNVYVGSNQQFTILANAFLDQRTYILQSEAYPQDMVSIGNKYYWPLPPLPAILMTPTVLLGRIFSFYPYQFYLHIILVFATFFLAFKLSKLKNFTTTNSLFLAFAFCFSSSYLGIAFNSMSWYLSHSITVFLALLSLYEFYTKKRFALIGILLALILATRTTGALITIFYILTLTIDKSMSFKDKIVNLAKLLIPVGLSALCLGYYNLIRFNNFTDTGYMSAMLLDPHSENIRAQYGLFNVQNIPTNLYWYFLKGLDPIYEGQSKHLVYPFLKASGESISFLITSFVFLKAFTRKPKIKEQYFLWTTVGIIFAILMTYVFYGGLQFGTRYTLDFLPLLFILLLYSFKEQKISKIWYALIIISALVNAYLYTTIWI
jgi:hypothetical protein